MPVFPSMFENFNALVLIDIQSMVLVESPWTPHFLFHLHTINYKPYIFFNK